MAYRKTGGQQVHEPDARDVRAMAAAIAQEFGLVVELRMKYKEEDVEMVAVACSVSLGSAGITVAQALSRRRLNDRRGRDAQAYSVLWDVYQQLDTGILGYNPRDIRR